MSVEPAWLNKEPINHGLNAKIALAQKAKDSGKWIFDKTTKLLYSPSEFVWERTVDIPIFKQHKAVMTNFELRDPNEFIKVRMDKIKELIKEIEIMDLRIKQYYKQVPKK